MGAEVMNWGFKFYFFSLFVVLSAIHLSHLFLTPASPVGRGLGVSDVLDTPITMGFKLQDFTDVQVMARMQEESKSFREKPL